ncbi:MAG TPA: 5-deoxy-glucuronate isomerase [Chthonomonadaceae bacterium]|nr:5-deoxy-glucuronate isomerase [Chthonomonadaceae bacterium]
MISRRSSLLLSPNPDATEYMYLTAREAGWEHLNFAARRMRAGGRWQHATEDNELALVVLGGVCAVRSSRGEWARIGRRPNVFAGMPSCLYLPRNTEFTVEALSDDLDIACGGCRTDEDHPARLVTPHDVEVEIRGGGNATRQINSLIPPGFDCHRLVVVEVYTPSGNWSSYPPHKHDVHREDAAGNVLEADLEEIYFYKMDRPGGYAYQRVYTSDGRLDELMQARDSCVVLVPEGYHPVVSAHGYTTYYLNVLAGSAQSLANSDDPEHAWIKQTWKEKDSRVPIVHLGMEG